MLELCSGLQPCRSRLAFDAGAIAGVRGVRNPVLLARAVMEKSEHVFLISEGAERFAREHGISFEDAEYFLTERRIAQLAEAKEKQARSFASERAQARHRWRCRARQIRQSRCRHVGWRPCESAVGTRRRFRHHRRWRLRGQRQLRRLVHGYRRTSPAHVARQDSCAIRRISWLACRRGRRCRYTVSHRQSARTRRS